MPCLANASRTSRSLFALRQAENGLMVDVVCRKMGVSEPTFYRWKKQFVGMGVPEIRRLKQPEEENSKLNRVVANLTFDRSMLQDVLKDQWWGPPLAVRSLVTCRWPTRSASVGPVWLPASAVRPSATSGVSVVR